MKKKNPSNRIPGSYETPGVPTQDDVIIGPDLETVVALFSQAKDSVQVPAGFASELEDKLLNKARLTRVQNAAGDRSLRRPSLRLGVMFAGAVTLAIIVLFVLPGLSPVLNRLASSPAVTPAEQTEGVNSGQTQLPQAGLTSSIPTIPSTVPVPGVLQMLDFFGSSALAQSETSSIFGKVLITLGGNLPTSPQTMTVYEQRAETAMTPALAREQAARLGIQGEVYQSSSEGGGIIYYVTDGLQEVWFWQGLNHFTYVASINDSMIGRPSNLSLEQRVPAAEAFLKKAGLLDFDYRVNETLSQGRRVVFDRVFNGAPLLETDNYNPYISVEVDDNGKVDIVMMGLNPIQTVGDYPIRSAEDAWRIVMGDPNDKRVQYTLSDPATDLPQLRASWNHTYPDGSRVDLTSYPTVLSSVDPGGQPWVTIGPFTLQGDLSSLLAAYNGPQDLSPEQKQMLASGEVSQSKVTGWSRFFHVWGQATTGVNGARYLQIEGWERSPTPDDTYFGVLQEENGSRLFVNEDGTKWILPDLPADVPLGERLSVRGVRVTDQPRVFDWSIIQVEPPAPSASNGGGGGGGGGGLSPFSLVPGVTATEVAPPPMPYQPGDRLEGVTTMVTGVEKILHPDGKIEMIYLASLSSPQDPLNITSVKLAGDNLTGFESLIMLHVKIWGTFQVNGDQPTIQVERYEKAYPNEIYQAWLGRQVVATLEGRQVMLFTDASGKQYVLARSLGDSPFALEDGFRGEQFILEGTLSPDTFAGYPIIIESMAFISPGSTDLNGYQVQGNQVTEIDLRGTQDQPSQEQDSLKEVVIDKVELVYFAYDLSHGGGFDLNTSPMRFVQPVWRFTGKLGDGRLVQILVQAVIDEYLVDQ